MSVDQSGTCISLISGGLNFSDGDECLITPISDGTASRRLGDQIVDQLREMILSGEIPPGTRIGQEALAEEFKVSRLPVRDALNRLESEGLVLLRANTGAWVAKLDLIECAELYQVRERLEPLAFAAAATRMSNEEIETLAALVQKMENAPDNETFGRLDRQFHLLSYQASGMKHIIELAERFWNRTQRYRRAYTDFVGSEGRWVIHAEHRLMIDALLRRDSAGAERLLTEHIRRTRFELEKHEDLFEAPELLEPVYRRSVKLEDNGDRVITSAPESKRPRRQRVSRVYP